MAEKSLGDIRNWAEEFLRRAELGTDQIAALDAMGYFNKPASLRHHLSRAGGLVEHSLNVTNWMLNMKDSFGCCMRPRSPYIIGMLHDLCKCACYEWNDSSQAFEWKEPQFMGHGSASVIMISMELGIILDPNEAMAIQWHMGAFGLDKDALTRYDAALKEYPADILLTHTADMMAARVTEGK